MFATQTLSRCWSTPLWSKIPTTAAAATTTAQVPRNAGRGHHPHLVGPGGGRSGICFSPPGASPTEGPETHHKIQGASPTAGGGVDHVGSLVFQDLTVRVFSPQIGLSFICMFPNIVFQKNECCRKIDVPKTSIFNIDCARALMLTAPPTTTDDDNDKRQTQPCEATTYTQNPTADLGKLHRPQRNDNKPRTTETPSAGGGGGIQIARRHMLPRCWARATSTAQQGIRSRRGCASKPNTSEEPLQEHFAPRVPALLKEMAPAEVDFIVAGKTPAAAALT